MVKNNLSVSVQKNCEILEIHPEGKEGHYFVTAKFTNPTSECVSPLHIKGSAETIGRIVKFLGERFAAYEVQEADLENPLLDHMIFEIKGKKLIVKNQESGKLEMCTDAPGDLDSEKIEEICLRFLKPVPRVTEDPSSSPYSALDSLPKIKALWAQTNSNRTIKKEDRIQQKISDLHAFVQSLAMKKGISEERITPVINSLRETGKNLNEILTSYRIQYFPELDAELKELQDCEECHKHFNIGS